MPSCVLKTCKNQSAAQKKDSGITYHQFPPPGHEKREKWIKFVQKNRSEDTWLPRAYTKICSDHFKKEDIHITKTGRIYLKKSAVPYDSGSDPKPGISKVEPASDSESLIGSEVSDSESIFDSPQKIMLKTKLSQEIAAKKVLADKIKKIQRQNRYLKKKCESYELIITDMQSKFGFDSQTENNHA